MFSFCILFSSNIVREIFHEECETDRKGAMLEVSGRGSITLPLPVPTMSTPAVDSLLAVCLVVCVADVLHVPAAVDEALLSG